MNYDKLYRHGGFRYSTRKELPYMQKIVCEKIGVRGKVIDAPCGDGFWSKLLKKCGCDVTSTDLSTVGVNKASGIQWDLMDLNPAWEGKFDWVFCRGPSCLHHSELGNKAHRFFDNLARYAPQIVVIYWTDQTNRVSRKHFNHTKKSLDRFFDWHCRERSFMWKSYYHAILSELHHDAIVGPGHPDFKDDDDTGGF